ncbi:hypothetical protein [Paenibacillus sp. SAF-054]|uniref:hypothetical protein n=1 Tax=Paenibacillus sp. SAF-054 TaxID=3436863 RepID=UPI003F7E2E75
MAAAMLLFLTNFFYNGIESNRNIFFGYFRFDKTFLERPWDAAIMPVSSSHGAPTF